MTPEDRKLMQQLRDAAVDLTEAYNEWYGVYLGEKTNENPYKEFIAAADARLAQPEPPVQSHEAWVKDIVKAVAELPDRNSPEGQPEMMLVSGDELAAILRNHPAAVPEDPPIEEVEAIIACLGDDAAQLRDKNPDCEIAANMDQAVALIRLLLAIPAADFDLSQPASGIWPDLIAPSQHENPAPGWEDPRLPDFRLIWKIARECGYSVGIHGSLKRDVDLIAAPWTGVAVGNAELVERLCAALPARRVDGPEYKPLGRVAVTLQIDGWYKPIDLSIAPRVLQPASEDARPAPEGFVLVPVEPTDAMVQATHNLDLSYMPTQWGADRAAVYKAMIAAAGKE